VVEHDISQPLLFFRQPLQLPLLGSPPDVMKMLPIHLPKRFKYEIDHLLIRILFLTFQSLETRFDFDGMATQIRLQGKWVSGAFLFKLEDTFHH
jgi:hypothetical protein